MANVIDSLLITLGMDSSGVSKGMKQAQGSIQQGVGMIKSLLAPMAGAFAFGSIFNNYTTMADSLGKLSESLDWGIQNLDAWSQAAKLSGGSAEGFQASLRGMNQKLQEFATTGEGEAKKVFAALGINAKDASGKVKHSSELLMELAGKAEKMDKAKFAGLAQKLGLDQGTIQLLQSGSKEVGKLVGEMKEISFTDDDYKAAAEYNDMIAKLGKSLTVTAGVLLQPLLKGLTFIGDKLRAGVAFLRKHEPFLIALVSGLALIIAVKLTPAIIKMGLAWLSNPLTWIVGMLVLLAIALDDIWTYINGGESDWGDYWEKLGLGEHTLQDLSAAGEWLIDVFKEYGPVLAEIAGGFGLVSGAMKVMGALSGTNPFFIFLTVAAGLIGLIVANWDKIKAGWESFRQSAAEFAEKYGLNKADENMAVTHAGGEFLDSDDDYRPGLISQMIHGDASAAVSPAATGAGGTSTVNNDNSTDTKISIGSIKIATRATEAYGIAGDITGAMRRSLVGTASTGVNPAGGRT
ncbi:phage tail tape measure protein [Desulfovibrio sp. OttesenSCG-928-A18]|nr:phage tail tape measure protein [Desulfovibrio sp. OttesenSCG-928-A18]